jgi:hypothetical protein
MSESDSARTVDLSGAQAGDVSVGQAAQTINNYYTAPSVEAQMAAARFADGLNALRDLIDASPVVRSTVVVFYDRLRAARAHVRELVTLKTVHDQLHGLQYKDLPALVRELRHFPDDDLARYSIADAAGEIRIVIEHVQQMVVDGELLPPIAAWGAPLSKEVEQIEAGLGANSRKQIDDAARRARSIVGIQLSKLNTSLAHRAADLRPEDVAVPLRELHARLTAQAAERAALDRVAGGIDGLLTLHAHLSILVQVHNGWQELEDELRRVETSLRISSDDLEWSWPDLSSRIEQLCAGSERWAVEICGQRDRVAEALEANAQAPARIAFDRLQLLIRKQFFEIDLALKEHCDRLRDFRDPLNDLEFALG